MGVTFEEFASDSARRVRAALVVAYGPDVGMDAAAEAMAYGWENWDRLQAMGNPAGYMFRVGQTAARKLNRPQGLLPGPEPHRLPDVEPGLVPALNQLSEQQRICVVLVHAYGWPQVEVAEVLEVSAQTVRTHCSRAIARLQSALEVLDDAN